MPENVKNTDPARYMIHDPLGLPIETPVSAADDLAYFRPSETEAIRQYLKEQGYVVIRCLVPPGKCDAATAAFTHEVKPSKRFIYRQNTSNPERHEFTDRGYMLNPILNVQSVDPRLFPGFRSLASDVLTDDSVQASVRDLFGEPGKVVQSMFFEGNPATNPHQDTYYLDSEHIGAMTAGWFALEDIAPGAGRFFVYPKSHLVDMSRNGGDFDIAFNHDRYKALVNQVIRDGGFECRAPALSKGDVLFWSGKIIHGSLRTTQPEFSRRSFTTHYIPDSHRFLQFQSRIKPLNLKRINGMNVHAPKDLASPKARAIFAIETNFPKAFQIMKRWAIKIVTR